MPEESTATTQAATNLHDKPKPASSNVPSFGPAIAASFLLRDFENYGLSERVRYHFHLSEVLGDSARLLTAAETNQNYRENSSLNIHPKVASEDCTTSEEDYQTRSRPRNEAPCGIARVLECIPPLPLPPNRLSRQQRSFLKTSLVQLNQHLDEIDLPCSEPSRLPLRINAATRVSFAYEITRIVFLVDASPSMTSTFGVAQTDAAKDASCCCPMDRLPHMARTLFTALAEKISLPYRQGFWQPKLSVSVLAIHSGGRTAILVRDFTVSDVASAEHLVEQVESWVLHTVEEDIASGVYGNGNNLGPISEGSNLSPTTFKDWWRAGKLALASLTSAARPCIIVATDGRSVSTDRALDDIDDKDVPFFILDLSFPPRPSQAGVHSGGAAQSMMADDPGADFPLSMSDDREALYYICKTLGGCMWETSLLSEASRTRVGDISTGSPLAQDKYALKLVRKHQPHMVRPNVVQWYTLFCLSPLSPTFNSNWGHLPPPLYLQPRVNFSNTMNEGPGPGVVGSQPIIEPNLRKSRPVVLENHKPLVRIQFSTYIINPVRILGLLLMRVKEGYRAIRYGQSTLDDDKVSIIMGLALELGTSLYYEVSYRSLPGQVHTIGHASIKIDISGEASFVQAVKADFLSASQRRPVTLAQQISAKLGRILRSIRREDLLQSYLSPVKWSDMLLTANSPFLRRLKTLSEQQKVLHFRRSEFDCVCVGRMPFAPDGGFLDAFQSDDNGQDDLVEAIASWATCSLGHSENALTFVRKLVDGLDGLPCYCLLGLQRSHVAPRLFTLSVEIFEGSSSAPRRLAVIASLKEMIARQKDVCVLEMQIAPSLMESRRRGNEEEFISGQYLHKSWELVYDEKLLHLVMRRRAELGGFWLLDSSDSHAFFGRVRAQHGKSKQRRDDPGDMVLYQISISKATVFVDLYMENEIGVFRNGIIGVTGKFETLATNLRKRDQECGHALRARSQALRIFDEEIPSREKVKASSASAISLIGYGVKAEKFLRAFHKSFIGSNEVLLQEVNRMLIEQSFGHNVAALSVDESMPGYQPGLWFLVQYDSDTLGIIHLSSEVTTSVGETKVPLTFYTISISDLYSRREDFVGDDDSDEDTVEENLSMAMFVERILEKYGYLYSRAAYNTLSKAHPDPGSIHMDDMRNVFKSLQFQTIAEVLVEKGGKKLAQSLAVIAKAIPGETYLFFYQSHENSGSPESDPASEAMPEDDEQYSQSSSSGDTITPDLYEKRNHGKAYSQMAPLFLSFQLDGQRASLDDLGCFRTSSKLLVQATVFAEDSNVPVTLPGSHIDASKQVKKVLDAYVAEQTLERLRHHGRSIQAEDVQLVRQCLQRADTVMASQIVLNFFSPTLDKMVSTADDAGGKRDIGSGTQLLIQEVVSQKEIEMRMVGTSTIVALGENTDATLLPYWCVVDFRETGIVSIRTHHPLGPEEARTLLSCVERLLQRQIHRVNQLIILTALHKSRTATTYMIEEESVAEKSSECPFACPIVFTKRFELFHRCATNPSQIAAKVETSAFHIFSLSNRRHVFVYKDEGGSVFYMHLAATGGGLEPDGVIDLKVHGVDKPSLNLTTHLSRLLAREILSIAVDLLATVLTKNPRYAWRPPDVQFVEEYNSQLHELEESKETEPRTVFYTFPSWATDPSTILLYFRQNLCGSSYFHPFIASNTNDAESLFVCYYNNFPSKLSVGLQGRSTLTAKGAEFARMAGQGLAIIQVSLLDDAGNPFDKFNPGQRIGYGVPEGEISHETAKVVKHDCLPDASLLAGTLLSAERRNPYWYVKVDITDTALRRSILHSWVELTLNQVTTAWFIERQIERQQSSEHPSASNQEALVEARKPVKMYEIAESLPHPAIQKIEMNGLIRASAVASMALRLLELVLEPVRKEVKSSSCPDLLSLTKIFRLPREKGDVSLVKLSWGQDKDSCLVSPVNSQTAGKDSHIDGSHYVIFFSSPEYAGDPQGPKPMFPKLFEELTVGDEYGEESYLIELKKTLPQIFRRSFAFFLSIQRERRLLFTYNLRTDLFEAMASTLKDEDISSVAAARLSTQRLLGRCVGVLSPELSRGLPSAPIKVIPSKQEPIARAKESPDMLRSQNQENHGRSQRAVRPVSIRRPKLVGKSVDGSAAHAVGAARARARHSASSVGPTPAAIPRMPPRKTLRNDSRRPMTQEQTKKNRLEQEFRLSLQKKSLLAQRHSLHESATNAFFWKLWPYKLNTVPIQVAADFILNQTNLEFVTTVNTLSFPNARFDLPREFATYLEDSSGGLQSLHAMSKVPSSSAHVALLRGRKRKMKGLECFPVLRIDTIQDTTSRKMLLRCSQWTVILNQPFAEFRFQPWWKQERSANGPDKLATTVRSAASTMESHLVQFLTKQAVEVFEKRNSKNGENNVRMVLEAEKRYPISQQIYMLRSEYKFFSVPLILKSFGNALIDHFTSPTLFRWLHENSQARRIVPCGSDALLLPGAIETGGAYAFCLLSSGSANPAVLTMSIVCHAKNIDLLQFHIKSGSYVAVTGAKSIAIKAAGVVYREVRAAAKALRLQSLWQLSSSRNPRQPNIESVSMLEELLGLGSVVPFHESAEGGESKDAYREIFRESLGIPWSSACDVMALEDAFLPCWTLPAGRRLYYCHSFDLFLLVHLSDQEFVPPAMDFVLKSTQGKDKRELNGAVELVMNFLLHCIWDTLVLECESNGPPQQLNRM